LLVIELFWDLILSKYCMSLCMLSTCCSAKRGPPGIGFNLTENGDYDIAGHKLVNVKQPENPGDAVNLQYLASAFTKWTSALHAAMDKVNDNMIKKDDSESVLKIVKPELSNMIKKR
jgi:hypothetical protein